MCRDISPAWFIGNGSARPDMVDAMQHDLDHIRFNETVHQPGKADITARGQPIRQFSAADGPPARVPTPPYRPRTH